MTHLFDLVPYQQYCIRFKYENKIYLRYLTVPSSWELNDVEKYLRIIFFKDTFIILKCSQKKVILFKERHYISPKEDEKISLYWHDGILWEFDMTIGAKKMEITLVSETAITEEYLFEKLKESYIEAENMSTFYKTECWIKNNNYII